VLVYELTQVSFSREDILHWSVVDLSCIKFISLIGYKKLDMLYTLALSFNPLLLLGMQPLACFVELQFRCELDN